MGEEQKYKKDKGDESEGVDTNDEGVMKIKTMRIWMVLKWMMKVRMMNNFLEQETYIH